MKNKRLLIASVLVGVSSTLVMAAPLGTAFTYQGQLTDGDKPANGLYDFQFSVMESPELGVPLDLRTTNGVPVNSGLFTVTLDFGAELFDGSRRWLEIEVKSNNAVGPYTLLSPRQELTAAPYAILAGSISGALPSTGLSGTYSSPVTLDNVSNRFTGNFTGDGGGLTNVNAGTLEGMSAASFWRISGNADTSPGTHFLGTIDNQALELRVNSARALRLEPNATSPSLIGGFSGNSIGGGTYGAVIAGGGAVGLLNKLGASSSYSAIGGGASNSVTRQSRCAAIAGGEGNEIDEADWSTVGGGFHNNIGTYSDNATIAGGEFNSIGLSSPHSVIGGGHNNGIISSSSGGIAGGGYNGIGGNSDYSVIGGGYTNRVGNNASCATISGGNQNLILENANYATISGGRENVTSNDYATVAGGYLNRAHWRATVGGGLENVASGDYATVPGGAKNLASAAYSFAAGNQAKATNSGALVWADNSSSTPVYSTANNQVSFRCAGGARFFSNSGMSLGVKLEPNATSWTTLSDRNAKQNIQSLNVGDILAQLAAMPITHWSYRDDPAQRRYIGPMAQDFHAAFKLGADDKHIATVDADGVALAAIQGLNQKVEERSRELKEQLEQKDAEIVALKERLAHLEKLMTFLTSKSSGGGQ